MKQIDLEVMSYNIWNLPLLTPRGSFKRMQKIAFFLKEVSTDIICLQEVWSLRTRKLLTETLENVYTTKSNNVIHRMYRKWLDFSSQHGGLFTLSKFPIISEKFIRFGVAGPFWTEWIGDKGFLETILNTPWGVLRVINTHLHQPLPSIRYQQLKNIFSYLEADQETPTIVAGDFNQDALLKDASFIEILKNTNFSYPDILTNIAYDTYRLDNHLTQTWLNKLKQSGHLDYIFIKGQEKLGLRINNYSPLYLAEPLSDHDPIVLTLSRD